MSDVFGTPITTQTLQDMPEYWGKPITAADRAKVARDRESADGKAVAAKKHVDDLKSQWGTGVSTKCMVYNATGDTVTLVASHDYHGHIGPSPYPLQIANGQWGAFLHVKSTGSATGSSACIAYRGKNNAGEEHEWLVGWSNPWNHGAGHKVTAYTEINKAPYYEGNVWGEVSGKLYGSGGSSTSTWNGCSSNATITDETTATFQASITLHA
ncbi:23 kDa jasmonate-induced protein-like [Malania oleifera]|uniref:23 kDa jasmonate-induced protein-like n=1 Tax=Malania oleifera TaxID=397392 RepID=UPI0025ADC260|nr:23 kDa jasmonate-induced protein-like [Malania oleifera]